jgi:hypothetical protein
MAVTVMPTPPTDAGDSIAATDAAPPPSIGTYAVSQGLTLVDVKAQLEQLQDTFISKVG